MKAASTIQERIISNSQGTVIYTYHRTQPQWLEPIKKQGWAPGTGAVFGFGLYTIHDLQQQVESNSAYGPVIIKFRVPNTPHILHFDYDTAKEVYGPTGYGIHDQLKRLGVYPNNNIPKFWEVLHKLIDKDNRLSQHAVRDILFHGMEEGNWKGVAANWPAELQPLFKQVESIKGVFDKWAIQGASYLWGGLHTLVMYDFMAAIPLAFSTDDGVSWESMLTSRDISNAKNALALKTSKALPVGSIKGLRTHWPESGEAVFEKLKQVFPWILPPRTSFSKAVIEVTSHNGKDVLNFQKGKWSMGPFNGLNFDIPDNGNPTCLFMNGTITLEKGGIFSGIFVGGQMKSGLFAGHWRGGIVDSDTGAIIQVQDGLMPRTSEGGAAGAKAVRWKGALVRYPTTGTETFTEWVLKNQDALDGLPYVIMTNGVKELFHVGKEGSHPYHESGKKKSLPDALFEKEFKYQSLTQAEKDVLFQNFTDSYVQATGSAFNIHEFEHRAYNWDFYGSPQGGIAVRRQNGGMLKLNASFGDVKEVMTGIREMMTMNQGVSIWGLMPDKLCRAMEVFTKKEFRKLPGAMVKLMFPYIAQALNVQVLAIHMDGGVEIDTPAGPMIKYPVANGAYRQWIKDQLANADKSKLPVPGPVFTALSAMVGLLL